MKTQRDPLRKRVTRSTAVLGAASFLAMLFLAGCNDSTTTIVQADDDPPAIPTGVYTITGDRYVEILWNPVRQSDVAGYGVYRSSTNQGPYQRLATLEQPLADSYIDDNVVNGVTYYYAVDAFDFAGNESELSYETAFDTPRPAGFGETLFSVQQSPAQAGIDFSRWNGPGFITSWNGVNTDLYLQRIGNVLFARGTVINQIPNDIQDLGYTDSLDEISWAPTEGWSVAPNGVEIIPGHTYVVWTHDSFFAKFRVTAILGPVNSPTGIQFDWAYQIDQNNPELSPPLALGGSGDNPGTT